jgi:hypothetical protein
VTQNARAFADDVVTITYSLKGLKLQFEKIQKYCLWAGLKLNPQKSAVTGALHHAIKTGLANNHSDRLLANQLQDKFKDQGIPVPFIPPDKPYPYLGVHICANLNFSHHLNALITTIKGKGIQLIENGLRPRQALQVGHQT